jgi:outer membrane protein assembly factor BamB
MIETAESDHAPNASQSHTTAPRRFRWKLGLGILVCGVIAETVALLALPGDRTRQVFVSMPIVSMTTLLLVLWWLFLSGLRWWTRLSVVLILVGLGWATKRVLRVDGFTGEMLPIVSLRTKPTAEERAANYW